MFHINSKVLLKEEKENGAAEVKFFSGICMTCEHSPDRENRAACPRADFFPVTAYISKSGNVKTIRHLCKNWELCAEIVGCFKKNEGAPMPQHKSNGKSQQSKFMPKYIRPLK
jgi:hypothetical protein